MKNKVSKNFSKILTLRLDGRPVLGPTVLLAGARAMGLLPRHCHLNETDESSAGNRRPIANKVDATATASVPIRHPRIAPAAGTD